MLKFDILLKREGNNWSAVQTSAPIEKWCRNHLFVWVGEAAKIVSSRKTFAPLQYVDIVQIE